MIFIILLLIVANRSNVHSVRLFVRSVYDVLIFNFIIYRFYFYMDIGYKICLEF